ncbi:MAG TPA: hypothetical protein VGM67_03650 [Gemmatimonadaceae bacterium]|jgi:hypothetical protein
MSLRRSLSTTVFAAAFVALAAVACATHPDAKAVPATNSSGAASGEVATTTTAATTGATAASVTPPTPAEEASHAARNEAPVDTSKAQLLASRDAHDISSYHSAIRSGDKMLANWPTGPSPLAGSLLPGKRIVAFYGNPLSKKMGVLGEYPTDVMLAKLDSTVALWQKADPSTPVIPALHLVAVTAQGAPGKDGGYRLRMDTALINKVYSWAQQKHALLFLDIQVGHSTLQQEIPRLLPYLAKPDVHLAIDAEFSMHYDREGLKPGTKVGQFDAADVNYAVEQLQKVVTENHLPPKILVVHRWTKKMISNASQIKLDPRVQVVMDMDGWGPPWLKFDSYRDYVVAEPVEFTGFKIFFHNDSKKEPLILTPAEVLRLRPAPLYIQYQ